MANADKEDRIPLHRALTRNLTLETIYGAYAQSRDDLRRQLDKTLDLGPDFLEADWTVMEILAALTHEKGAVEDAVA